MKINYLITFWLLFLSYLGYSQEPIIWSEKNNTSSIGDKVWVLEDNNFTIEEVSSEAFNSKYRLSNQKVLNFSNTKYYWLKFSIQNGTNQKLLLEIAQPIVADVNLYFKDSLGKWDNLRAGYQIPLAKKAYKHHYQIFPLQIKKGEYFVRLQSKSMSLPISIWEEGQYEDKSSIQKIIFGIFTGLMIFVVLINIFLFLSLRKFPHLHYAILVFFYYLIAANVEGFIIYIFPGLDLFYGMFIFAIINMPIGVSFAMLFLATKKVTPRIHKIGLILIIYYLSYIVWHWFLPPMLLTYISNFHGLLVVLIMATFGIQAGRNGNKMGYYFFVAYLCFFILAVIDTKSKLTGTPPYIFDLTYISIGFLVEAIALSYLLTVRFDWENKALIKERLDTQLLLLEQTKANERMALEQSTMLENEVKVRTADLNKSLLELKQAQAQLIQSEKMASLGELTAGIAHEIQNPLNFVNNFSDVSKELVEELNEEIERGDFEEAKLISKDLIQNLEKINHHGNRASSIVKGMLEHSRTSTGKKEPTDINALADEYLRLAYHGLRAKDKSFNANFETNFDPKLPKVKVVSQDMGRVILNLINNAFQAVGERSSKMEENYKPKVIVATSQEPKTNGRVLITISDNGPGIPDEIRDKIFQPFFTTKPTGKGTGLGLSLVYDIVKEHGGTLEVESSKNKGATFRLRLPIST